MLNIILAIYVLGIVWALFRTDASPLARVALALLWPLGPIAFGITLTILLAASLIAFPLFGAAVLGAAAVAWWAFT